MKLTPQEQNVLVYVALGYSDKEIGQKLKIAYSTVRTYMERCVLKLAAKNRTNAAFKYLLTIPPDVYLQKVKKMQEVL